MDKNKDVARELAVLRMQIMYIMHPHNRMRDKLLTSIYTTFPKIGIKEGSKLHIEIGARLVKACAVGPERRKFLLEPLLDLLDYIEEQ